MGYVGTTSVDWWLGDGSLGWSGASNACFVFGEARGEGVEEGPDMCWREGVGFDLTVLDLLAWVRDVRDQSSRRVLTETSYGSILMLPTGNFRVKPPEFVSHSTAPIISAQSLLSNASCR